MSGALVLFTRDLRVRDQPALSAAAREHDELVALFVLDRLLLRSSCGAPNRVSFLLQALRDLDSQLRARGAQLLVREGDVVEEAMRIVSLYGLSTLHMSADVTPYARHRHARLTDACARERVALFTHPGVTVVPAGALTPAGGDHYRMFTPYWRVWSALPIVAPLRAPAQLRIPAALARAPQRELPVPARLTRAHASGSCSAAARASRALT